MKTKDLDLYLIRLSPHLPPSEADKPDIQEIRFAKETDILSPVLVRQVGNKAFPAYEILGQEKSWYIAQEIQRSTVPATIMEHILDTEAKELIQLRKRTKTQDPILWAKEADALIKKKRQDKKHYSLEDAARALGVERSRLSHALRMIRNLHPSVQDLVSAGKIKAGHARRLASLKLSDQINLSKKIIQHKLSVRDVEAAVKKKLEKGRSKRVDDPIEKPVHIRQLEELITQTIGNQATLEYRESTKSGKLVLDFHNLGELQGIIGRLGVNVDV